MKEIVLKVKDGQVSAEAFGFQGQGCHTEVKRIMDSVNANIISTLDKPEVNEVVTTSRVCHG